MLDLGSVVTYWKLISLGESRVPDTICVNRAQQMKLYVLILTDRYLLFVKYIYIDILCKES